MRLAPACRILALALAHFLVAMLIATIAFGPDMDQLSSRSAGSSAAAAVHDVLSAPHDAALRTIPNEWLIRHRYVIPIALVLNSIVWGAGLYLAWAALRRGWHHYRSAAPNTAIQGALARGRPRHLRRYPHALVPEVAPRPTCSMSTGTEPDPVVTIYTLIPGVVYVVRQPFSDYYGNAFREHERLRFRTRSFVPYHGGHTLEFEERPMYLHEEANADVIEGFARFVERG
jgi:hypothetical protein